MRPLGRRGGENVGEREGGERERERGRERERESQSMVVCWLVSLSVDWEVRKSSP